MNKSYFTVILLIACFEISFGQNSNFVISRNSAGPVQLGITDKEAINKVLQLGYDTATVKAWKYLIDGGGTGTEVSKDGEILMFFWTFWNDNIVHGITIISPKYKTEIGIGTGSLVSNLLHANPNYEVTIDIELTSTEHIKDNQLNAQFIFLTKDDNRIGQYDFEQWNLTSKPKRLDATIDWITFWQGSFPP